MKDEGKIEKGETHKTRNPIAECGFRIAEFRADENRFCAGAPRTVEAAD
jgi:hypothetical protein